MKSFFLKCSFRVARFVLQRLPLRSALRVGAAVGVFVAFFMKREERITEVQLRWALPDLLRTHSPKEIFRQTFEHTGRTAAEVFHISELISHVTESSLRPLAQITNERKGAIVLSGHIGCIELLAAYHRAQGANVVTLARAPNYEFLIEELSALRKSYGVPSIWRESTSGMSLLKTIRAGTSVAALIDQDTELDNVFLPFFGITAAYPVSLIRMAVRFERPVFTSFIVRISELEHRIYSEEIIYSNASSPEEYILSEFSKRLEALLFQYPAQWPWWHRRWRRQPERQSGEDLRSTQEYIAWLEEKVRTREASLLA